MPSSWRYIYAILWFNEVLGVREFCLGAISAYPMHGMHPGCMYVFGGKKFGKFNPYTVYVNIINAHTGKRSYSANSPSRVFPKCQRISEENNITYAVDTAVVTVFVEDKHDRHVKYQTVWLNAWMDWIGIEWIASLTARETASAIVRDRASRLFNSNKPT